MVTVKEIFDNPVTRTYIKASKEVAKYYRIDCHEPTEISKRYQKALCDYRSYLDLYNIHMPKQIYKLKGNK